MSELGIAFIAQLDAGDLALLRDRLGTGSSPKPERLRIVDTWMSVEEAASRVGIHQETVRRAARDGTLRAQKMGAHWRIRAADVDGWGKRQPQASRRSAARPRRSAGNALKDALADV